jgi:hypothetical protein
MKTTKQIALALLALGASACMVIAQDSNQQQPPDGNGPPSGGQGGPGMGGPGMGGRRPTPPLIAALDANHDGVIDADEIANAPTALKKLDKNGDGKLTQDELRPPRPQGGRPPQGGEDSHQGPPEGQN